MGHYVEESTKPEAILLDTIFPFFDVPSDHKVDILYEFFILLESFLVIFFRFHFFVHSNPTRQIMKSLVILPSFHSTSE